MENEKWATDLPEWVSAILEAEMADKHCSRAQALRDWALAYAKEHYPDLAPESAVEALKNGE